MSGLRGLQGTFVREGNLSVGTEEQANMGKQGGEIRALQEGGCVHRGGEMECGWSSELWASLDRAKFWHSGQDRNLTEYLSHARHFKNNFSSSQSNTYSV